MKTITRGFFILFLVVISMSVFLLNGCGNDDEATAPFGSTITISHEKSWDSGSTGLGCTGSIVNDDTVTITVLAPNGSPMNNVVIFVELDLSSATSTINCMTLFDADTGDPVTSPYRTVTGDSGTKNMRIRMDLGAEYKGELKVYSGTAFSSAPFEVKTAT